MPYRGKRCDTTMTPHESGRGWAFFFLFTMVFPFLMGLIQRYVDILFPVAEANVLYYLFSASIVFILFWQFLKNSFSYLLDNLGKNLLSIVIGFVAAIPLHILAMKLPYPVENPNLFSYPEQFTLSSSATLVILLVLVPIVEEVLFRVLLFGSIRSHSRLLAWLVSVSIYCFYSVWLFAFVPSGGVDLRYLTLGIQYLPSALALTLCYEKSGCVWSSMVLHAVIHAAFLSSALSAYNVL